ncbi:hypothetical protein C8F04DRAFT_1255526 [Mycena alexandri]|uniref:N-acetyltransferase domain-containing protein n=1 Tax=Mycena alexandri TaxID=1745969 RepID=A0AAD6T3A4_9AGAR|nr:hypothetical protein C8F04DRAFT_1255526 [Mycena alexandri]
MSPAFSVRKLDPSTAVTASNPGSLPEMDAIRGLYYFLDLFTTVVTGHDPEDPGATHIGPFFGSTVVAALLGGEVYVAETTDTKKIIGCAVWFGPGHTLFDTPEQQQHALGPLMASFNKELQAWWLTTFLPKYDSFLASTLSEGTKHAAWHLQTLAVDPEYQQKGAGRLLVNAIVDKAAPTKTALCVECSTETNIEVYTKMGFHLMPKDNSGPDSCKATYTGVKGHSVPISLVVPVLRYGDSKNLVE